MKIVLTGCTGFIGGAVLKQCLSHPAITSVVVLTRRDVEISSPKLKVVILSDFESYSRELLTQLQGATACVYALGSVNYRQIDDARKCNLNYTLAAAKAFKSSLMETKFRFVYCSGYMTEKDQNRALWFLDEFRKMRGEVENQLLDLNSEGFEVDIARPGFVTGKRPLGDAVVHLMATAINVNGLAAAMIEMALHGSKSRLIENEELVSIGKTALQG